MHQAILRAIAARSESLLALALFAIVLTTWLRPLGSSYWIDEAATAWMSGGNFGDMLRRGQEFSGGHPFYYALAWASSQLFGSGEWGFRLLSTLSMAVAAGLLVAIGRELRDRELGLISAISFASLELIQFHARDARPYGVASALILAATYNALRWRRTERRRDAWLTAFFAALIFHNHFVHALHALTLGMILLLRRPEGARLWPKHTLSALGLGALIALPGIWPLLGVARGYDTLVYADAPTLAEFFHCVTFGATLPQLALATAVALGLSITPPVRPRSIQAKDLWLLAQALLLAPALVWLLSNTTDLRIFQPRYVIASAGAFALLVALGLKAILARTTRTIAVLVFAILVISAHSSDRHHRHDWRKASALVADAVAAHGPLPVLLRSGLIEGRRLDWLDHGERKDYLDSPLLVYPVPARILTLPYDLASPAHAEFLAARAESVRAEPGVILIWRVGGGGLELRDALVQRLETLGFIAPPNPVDCGAIGVEVLLKR